MTTGDGARGESPAWRHEDLTNPHAVADKATRVQGMFSAIAPSYDINNRVHSLWLDQSWRKSAVKAAQVKPGDLVLDIACGTGDLTMAFAKSPASAVIGVDYTPAMLEIAGHKKPTLPEAFASKVSYEEGDAQSLRFADASADVISIAFGIRNVADPMKALREFARILKPGGRLVVLEFERPRVPPFSWFYDLYCGWIMPRTATIISGDRTGAYRYLPASVGTFMTKERMLDSLKAAGFRTAAAKSLSFGICNCFVATR